MFRPHSLAGNRWLERRISFSGRTAAIVVVVLSTVFHSRSAAATAFQAAPSQSKPPTTEAEKGTGDRDPKADRKLLADFDTAIDAYADHADYARFDRELAAAFRGCGLDLDVVDPKTAGAQLAGRTSTPEIAAAIDEWCRIRRTRLKVPTWKRLTEVARAADLDPWRNAVLDQYDRPAAETLPALRARAADLKALEKQPVNSLLLLSTMLVEADDQPTAAAVLRVAKRRYPGDYWVCLLQGTLAVFGAPNPDPAEAARLCAAAVTQHPKSPLARLNRALALQLERKFDEATREFREAIRLKPDDSQAHIFFGGALGQQGKNDAAIGELREAIRLKPDYAEAYYNLATVLGEQEKFDEADQAYDEARRLKPDIGEAP
jgi:tetratricopeptide (TPR) repeat protein